jgi:serine/threonine protein phosphatase 1
MLSNLRQLFRRSQVRMDAAVPAGERIYAIGDIHGRLDLFEAMIAAIERDDAARGSAQTTVILLGDLVDRGPESAGVVTRAMQWCEERKVRIIGGNHEELFLESFSNEHAMRNFLRYGGRETVLSYPVDPRAFHLADIPETQAMMARAVPQAHRDFIARFEPAIQVGDYLFVHAGIRPDIALANQTANDLRWIREPFLSYAGDHGCVVVHGHTITDEPVLRSNRIGLDTGAFMSGHLTALGLEGSRRWLIETGKNGISLREV